MIVWITIVTILCVLFVILSLSFTPQAAIGWIVAISWLFPAWFLLPLFEGTNDSIVGTGPDVKFAVGTICLLLYCFMPGRTFPIRLVACDYAMLLLVVAHFVSDVFNDGFSWIILGRTYAEWYLPYVAGRVALQSWQDASRLWVVLASVGLLMAVTSVVEGFTNINFFESLFGNRPEEGTNREAARWGIQRAFGPALHPIYFGAMQSLLMGWAAFATVRAFKRRANTLWVFVLIPIAAGIACTGSRGPVLGIVAGAIGVVFCFLPRARLGIAAVVVTLIVGTIAFQEPIIRQLEKWSGERRKEVVIDGEVKLQSSVRSRINLIAVNNIALKRSGLLGFGTQAVTGFPINVPVGPMEAEALKQVRFIDNTYILLTLRFGYWGAGSFILAALISLGQFFYVGTRYQGDSPQWFCHCVGAGLFGALLVLATVWMPYEIGFIVVWTFGISSGLMLAHTQGKIGVRRKVADTQAE